MSFLPSARSSSSDPLSSRLKRIQEELRKSVQDNFQDEDLEKQDANATDYSILFWNDTASFVSAKPVTTAHLMPIEPKPDLLLWWYRHDHRGNFLYDQSHNDNHGQINGQPRLNPDGVDWGAFGGDLCAEYAYWTGDSVRDSVFGILRPTLINGVIQDTGGFIFDGINDYMDLGVDATKWGASLTSFSFSFWMIPQLTGGDGNYREIVYHGWGTNYSWDLYWSATAKTLVFELAGIWPARIGSTTFSFVGKPLDDLYYVTVVYDSTLGSLRCKIYVNGVLGVVGTDNVGAVLANNTTTIIGGPGPDYRGRILDFKWWTNIPLNQPKINLLYAAGPNGPVDPTVNYPDYWLEMTESGKPETKYYSYVRTPDSIPLRITGMNNFSVSALVYTESFELTNGQGDIWVCKVDDPTNTWAYQLQGWSDARVYFICSVNGVLRNYMTTAPVMHGKNWYWVVGTYDNALADPKSRIYVNGVNQAISIGGGAQWVAGGTQDLLQGIGHQLDRGHHFGRVQDTRLYNKTLSATEVLNMWNNKISITDTVFGQTATIGGSPFNE